MARELRPRFFIEVPRPPAFNPALLGFLGASAALLFASAEEPEPVAPVAWAPPRDAGRAPPPLLQLRLDPEPEEALRPVLLPVPREQAMPPPWLRMEQPDEPDAALPAILIHPPREAQERAPPWLAARVDEVDERSDPILLPVPRRAEQDRAPPPWLALAEHDHPEATPQPMAWAPPRFAAAPAFVIVCPVPLDAGRDALAVLEAGRDALAVLQAGRDAIVALAAGRDAVAVLAAGRDAVAVLQGGKCVAKTGQNDAVYQGNKRILEFTVLDTDAVGEPAMDISGATVRWVLTRINPTTSKPVRSPPLLAKSTATSGVVITDGPNGVVRVTLNPVDTSGLADGDYYQELELVDSGGDPYVVATGTLTVLINVQDT